MAAYVVLRVFYSVYFIVTGILILRAFSSLVFNGKGFKHLLLSLGFTIVWPLALFSRSGRERFYDGLNIFSGGKNEKN